MNLRRAKSRVLKGFIKNNGRTGSPGLTGRTQLKMSPVVSSHTKCNHEKYSASESRERKRAQRHPSTCDQVDVN